MKYYLKRINKFQKTNKIYQTPKRMSTIKIIPSLNRSDPDLGNLLDMGKAGGLHLFLVQEHEKMGDIFSFWWGKEQVVSLGHPIYWHAIRHLFDRPPELFKFVEPLLGKKSIQYANGEEGKMIFKNLIKPNFTNEAIQTFHIKAYKDFIDSQAMPLWKECADNLTTLPLHDFFMKSALQIVIYVAFGFHNDKKEIEILVNSYKYMMNELERQLVGDMPDSNRKKESDMQLSIFKEKGKEIISRNLKREKNTKEKTCFLDFLNHVEDVEFVLDNIISILIGGSHTTGNLLFWATYFLAKDEERQNLVYKELKENMGSNEFLEINSSRNFKYLRLCINESLRLSALAPWAARVDYKNDIEMPNDYIIPKATPMVIPLGKVLKSDLWKESDEFNPERFTKEDIKYPLQFSPFGFAGGRVCPGKSMALMETQVILAALFRNFKLTIPEDKKDVKMKFQFVTSPFEEINGNIYHR